MANTVTETGILQTMAKLQQLKDIHSILETVLLEARKLANADVGIIFLANRSGLTFNFVQTNNQAVNNDVIASHYRNCTIPIDKTSIIGYCAATGEQIAIDDAYELPPDLPFTFNLFFDRTSGFRTRSVFALPLKTIDNTLVGVMELINAQDENNAPISFSPEIRKYIARFAEYAAAAIEQRKWDRERYKDIPAGNNLTSPSISGRNNPNIVREQQLACGCPEDIFREIKYIVTMMVDDFDFDFLDLAFDNIQQIFNGNFPGYQANNTSYHNLDHTMAVALALIRLVHGKLIRDNSRFSRELIECGIIAAFFHDSGLIQKKTDNEGTGAKYTKFHEERSILFVQEYLNSVGRSALMGKRCAQMIQCTKLSNVPRDIPFESEEVKLMGYCLGTADIIAQMADRIYLERLPLLFDELKEGGIPGYESEVDIYHKTVTFSQQVINKRLFEDFDGTVHAVRHHFMERWDISENLYINAIENNIKYIEFLNKANAMDGNFYRQYLRRQIID